MGKIDGRGLSGRMRTGASFVDWSSSLLYYVVLATRSGVPGRAEETAETDWSDGRTNEKRKHFAAVTAPNIRHVLEQKRALESAPPFCRALACFTVVRRVQSERKLAEVHW